MRVNLVNDPKTIANSLFPPSIKVFKGSKQGGKRRIGENLNHELRIEASPEILRIIKKYYSYRQLGDSVLVSELRVVPCTSNSQQALSSTMALYKTCKLVSQCDRQIIYLQYKETTDQYGSVYRQPVATAEPCPVAGTNHKCPRGCVLQGDLRFYILELLLEGYSEYARLRTTSFHDNRNLAITLDSIEQEITDIKKSPFICEEFRSYVVYRLYRQQTEILRPVIKNKIRTKERSRSTDWLLKLELLPEWKAKHDSWKQITEIKAQALLPSNRLVNALYGSSFVEIEATAVTESPALPPSTATEDTVKTWENYYRAECAIAYKNYGWTKEDFIKLIEQQFGKKSLDQSWENSQLEALLNALQNF